MVKKISTTPFACMEVRLRFRIEKVTHSTEKVTHTNAKFSIGTTISEKSACDRQLDSKSILITLCFKNAILEKFSGFTIW